MQFGQTSGCDLLPDVRRAVLAQALVVESVYLRNLPALVVTADQRNAVRVADLDKWHNTSIARVKRLRRQYGMETKIIETCIYYGCKFCL